MASLKKLGPRTKTPGGFSPATRRRTKEGGQIPEFSTRNWGAAGGIKRAICTKGGISACHSGGDGRATTKKDKAGQVSDQGVGFWDFSSHQRRSWLAWRGRRRFPSYRRASDGQTPLLGKKQTRKSKRTTIFSTGNFTNAALRKQCAMGKLEGRAAQRGSGWNYSI